MSEVQYICNTNYRRRPPTASGTYVCEIGGSFTYTEFECQKGIVVENELQFYNCTYIMKFISYN